MTNIQLKADPEKKMETFSIEPNDFFLSLLVEQGEKILITGHHSPDGDSLGSSAALALALKEMGLGVVVGLPGKNASSLNFLLNPPEMFKQVELEQVLSGEYGRLILVDCQMPNRVWLEITPEQYKAFPPYIVIDHHQSDAPSQPFLAGFIDHQASATAELVFKVLKKLKIKFTKPIVESLLTALISDTGSFSQNNATPECLRQAAELVALGGDIERINQKLKQNWALSRIKLLTAALSSLTLHYDGRVAVIILTSEMLSETGSDLTESEGFVEYPLLLAGVKVSALIKINGRGKTRVSLRSRSSVDVRALARSFGGGGHVKAAAYLDDSSDPKEAKKNLLEQIGLYIKEAND
ncbi:MAG: bifunctional oligoribonuclease/PAP phosphatase NrnA [Deltaproteobacteria bacterium]|jgi:phosphoesterase RecJ-like protein|nr:bifunctional oligoribonuclease/PAP phosphatase NrnA [Deltaproteobacteria bacterium]